MNIVPFFEKVWEDEWDKKVKGYSSIVHFSRYLVLYRRDGTIIFYSISNDLRLKETFRAKWQPGYSSIIKVYLEGFIRPIPTKFYQTRLLGYNKSSGGIFIDSVVPIGDGTNPI